MLSSSESLSTAASSFFSFEFGDSSNLSGEGLRTGEVGWEEAIVA